MDLFGLDQHRLREGARVSLQAALAAAVAWLLCDWLLPPHASWPVISSIYVVSQSAGGTLKAALGRALGTVFGTLIGLIFIFVMRGATLTAARVALAALAGSIMTSLRPGWRFGIVAAVIVALEQDTAVLGSAMERVAAILIGTVAGVAAAFLVWRETAEQRTARALSVALAGCRELLEGSLEALGGEAADLRPSHRKILNAVRQADEEASSATVNHRVALQQRVRAVQRLWHALMIIGRATGEDWPVAAMNSGEVRRTMREVKDAALERIDRLDLQGGCQPAAGDDRLEQAVEGACRATDPAAATPDSGWQAIMQGGLAFALVEVKRNIGELEELLQRERLS